MASELNNISDVDLNGLIDISSFSISVVVSSYYPEITGKLYEGALAVLKAKSLQEKNFHKLEVPGSYEIIAGAVVAVDRYIPDCVICLGCVIKGETQHNEYINQSVANGLAELTIRYKTPFIYGLLTTENRSQAIERAGGSRGNKGIEAAVAAIKMLEVVKVQKDPHKAGFRK